MTNKEAIKMLDRIRDESGWTNDAYNSLTLAIEALEKQIPKKPTTGKYGHTECACCGWVVDSFCGDIEQYPFCPNCGQAIDWRQSIRS